MTEVVLSARAIEKSYGRTQALRGVSLDLARGEVLAVTGPSGGGKSTLLHCLAGILRPEAGDVRYENVDLGELPEGARTRLRRREFGIVLQFGQLVPELTVEQNVDCRCCWSAMTASRRAPRRGHGSTGSASSRWLVRCPASCRVVR
ncbi:MAG: ATP-binding cassette domain-containing protein, partial [Actinomycetes bacterium]